MTRPLLGKEPNHAAFPAASASNSMAGRRVRLLALTARLNLRRLMYQSLVCILEARFLCAATPISPLSNHRSTKCECKAAGSAQASLTGSIPLPKYSRQFGVSFNPSPDQNI